MRAPALPAAQEDEEASNDLSNADIVTKYRTAGDIANKTLAAIIAACVPGSKCVDVCAVGDKTIDEAVAKIYVRGRPLPGASKAPLQRLRTPPCSRLDAAAMLPRRCRASAHVRVLSAHLLCRRSLSACPSLSVRRTRRRRARRSRRARPAPRASP